MTSIDKDGVTVPALGHQASSTRKSSPIYSLSKVGRLERERVYITEEHIKTVRLGRESPKAGAIYDLPPTLNARTCGFGSGKRPEMYLHKDDPDDVPTNDAMDIWVDSQQFKYRRDPTIIIGTEPRGKLKEVTLVKNHAAAFFGRESPGPAAIGETYGPKMQITKPRLAMACPFGLKDKSAWMRCGDNPPKVGPGRHERKDVAIGPQLLSRRRNQTVNAFGNAAKFPKSREADGISVLDAAFSCMGKQTLDKHRSEPSIGFNRDTRDIRSRTAICMTRLDHGPSASLPRFVCSMPTFG